MTDERSIDCERFLREAWLVETGELEPEARAAWEAHRERCAACRRALEESAAALESCRVATDVDLDEVRFERMVVRARRELDRARAAEAAAGRGGLLRGFLGVAAAVALVVLGGWIGRATAPEPTVRGELASLRAELREARADAALASMERPSASERIHGVTLASRVEGAPPEILDAIVGVLERDPTPNVRLAAVDALRAVDDLGPVRTRLLAALAGDPSPAIRIALIDLLVERRLEGGAEALERLEAEAEDPAVRERAAWARRALS